jgi:hypothetical protein
MGEGFVSAEGAGPLRYFWEEGGKFYCRQLTWGETEAFCAASGTPLPG